MGQEEAVRQEFAAEGLVLNFVSGSTYLGAYIGPQEDLAAWTKPQVEAWSHRVRVIVEIVRQQPLVGLCCFGNVVATQVAVPAKYSPLSWHPDGSH